VAAGVVHTNDFHGVGFTSMAQTSNYLFSAVVFSCMITKPIHTNTCETD
jgi:hypothetical protein